MGPDVFGDLAYQFTALSERDDGFQWPAASKFILMYHVLVTSRSRDSSIEVRLRTVTDEDDRDKR